MSFVIGHFLVLMLRPSTVDGAHNSDKFRRIRSQTFRERRHFSIVSKRWKIRPLEPDEVAGLEMLLHGLEIGK
ncbi:hypothetical protein AUV02_10540 [Micrococcus sp. CH3]|nr:hypothetical protein AUV02_10540 [Micrococcus sp. CH3]KYK08202.1 hypothetical protein AUV08_10385 [Micrococcus sp. CH7]